MRYFKQTSTGEIFAFEDDVDVISKTNGEGDTVASIPDDLEPYDIPELSLADRLQQAKQTQIRQLRRDARDTINGGAVSEALGSPHVYPTDVEARSDLQGSVVDSLLHESEPDWMTEFACAQPGAVNGDSWPMVGHTAPQIRQVGTDVKRWYTAQKAQLRVLVERVEAVTGEEPSPIATVESIVWTASD